MPLPRQVFFFQAEDGIRGAMVTGVQTCALPIYVLKNKVDETLTFRRSCREGVCGSDGMNINGKNMLACTTHLSQFKDSLVIRPLPGFPIIRDLVVDMTQFY